MVQDSKIHIIGGAGFLGSSLIKLFNKQNISYVCCDLKESPFAKSNIYLDIESPETLSSISKADILINLAAMHRDDITPISRYDDVNVQGSRNICDAARKYGINKIIFTSSVAIYGFAPPNTDESGDPEYFNDYGRTKFLAESVYREWQAEDPERRMLVIVRPTVIFGEGNRGNVYNLLKQIYMRRFAMFGDGKNRKSMAYVENVASFINYSSSFDPGLHIYNYIDKPDFDMNTLVSLTRKILFGKNNIGIRFPSFLGLCIGYLADFIAKLTGRKLPISSIRVKKFLGTTQFSSSIDKTGFIPPVTLEEGLTRTLIYEFIEDNSSEQIFETE